MKRTLRCCLRESNSPACLFCQFLFPTVLRLFLFLFISTFGQLFCFYCWRGPSFTRIKTLILFCLRFFSDPLLMTRGSARGLLTIGVHAETCVIASSVLDDPPLLGVHLPFWNFKIAFLFLSFYLRLKISRASSI